MLSQGPKGTWVSRGYRAAARVSLADHSVQDTSGAGATVAFMLLSGRNGAKCRRAASSPKRRS